MDRGIALGVLIVALILMFHAFNGEQLIAMISLVIAIIWIKSPV